MQRTTINDLPPDVLLSIFRIHLLENRKPPRPDGTFPPGWDNESLGEWRSYDQYVEMLAFPESLASVCRRWREVMSSVSAFWTRLAIRVGDDPTPLSRIREYLKWSRGHLINIHVFEPPEPPANVDPMVMKARVHAQMKEVMGLLVPHMARWAWISIYIQYSSPLPRPTIDLVGRAENLEGMQFLFTIDDSVDGPPLTRGQFETPILHMLDMGGLHFRQSYVDTFPRVVLPDTLSNLSLRIYGAHHPPFRVVDLVRCLDAASALDSIEFESLDLDFSYAGPPPEQRQERDDWDDLHFSGMKAGVISEFDRLLDYPYVETRSYARCTMEGVDTLRVGGASSLHLSQVACPATLFRFLAAVPNDPELSFHSATFYNCGAMQPHTLHMLSAATPGANFWWCPYLQSLTIIECSLITGVDVRRLVQARAAEHQASGFAGEDDPEFVVNPLESLCVCDCGELSDEDREWLDAHIKEVQWDDWHGGYGDRA